MHSPLVQVLPLCECKPITAQLRLSDGHLSVLVGFNNLIAQEKSPISCNDIFYAPFLSRTVRGSKCSFLNSTHLVITPLLRPSLGHQICIHEGSLSCNYPTGCAETFASGCRTLTAEKALPARAILVASNFSSCSNLYLDGSQSSAGAGTLFYSWTTGIWSSMSSSNKSCSFNRVARDPMWLVGFKYILQNQNTSSIDISSDEPRLKAIPVDQPLCVTLTVIDTMGSEDSSTIVIRKIESRVPTIRSGFTQSSIAASRETLLHATADTILCDGSRSVTALEWSMENSTGSGLRTLDVTLPYTFQRTTFIPPNTLRKYIGQRIDIVCRASNTFGLVSEWRTSVDVIASPPRLVLVGTQTSISRHLPYSVHLIIDDPDEYLNKADKIQWTCIYRKNQSSCLPSMDPYSRTLVFEAHSLYNGIYDISASVTKLGTRHTSTGWLEVVESQLLAVVVSADFNLANFNRDLNVTLVCSVRFDNKSDVAFPHFLNYSYVWSISGGAPDAQAALTNSNDASISLIGRFLEPGITYEIKVEVAEANSKMIGLKEVELYTAPAPQGGRLQVTPENGVALETLFRILTSEWQGPDDSRPFVYEFSYITNNGIRTLIVESLETTAQTFLVSGNITIIVRVTNVHGCSAELSASFFVWPSRTSTSTALESNYRDSLNSVDWISQLSLTQLILDSFDSYQMTVRTGSRTGSRNPISSDNQVLSQMLHESVNSWRQLPKSEGVIWSMSGVLQRLMRLMDGASFADLSTLTQASLEVVQAGWEFQHTKGRIIGAFVQNMEVLYTAMLGQGSRSLQELTRDASGLVGPLLVKSAIYQISILHEIQASIELCGFNNSLKNYGTARSQISSVNRGMIISEIGGARMAYNFSNYSSGRCLSGVLTELSGVMLTKLSVDKGNEQTRFATNTSYMGNIFTNDRVTISAQNDSSSQCLRIAFESGPDQFDCAFFNLTSWSWSHEPAENMEIGLNGTIRVDCPCPPLTPVSVRYKSSEPPPSAIRSPTQSTTTPHMSPALVAVTVCCALVIVVGIIFIVRHRANHRKLGRSDLKETTSVIPIGLNDHRTAPVQSHWERHFIEPANAPAALEIESSHDTLPALMRSTTGHTSLLNTNETLPNIGIAQTESMANSYSSHSISPKLSHHNIENDNIVEEDERGSLMEESFWRDDLHVELKSEGGPENSFHDTLGSIVEASIETEVPPASLWNRSSHSGESPSRIEPPSSQAPNLISKRNIDNNHTEPRLRHEVSGGGSHFRWLYDSMTREGSRGSISAQVVVVGESASKARIIDEDTES